MSAKQTIETLLAKADVKINGSRPWDLQVHNERLYSRVLSQGSLGLGESYMEGWWDCQAIDQMIERVFRAGLDKQVKSFSVFLLWLKSRLSNRQSKARAFQVGEEHYDLGNDLFECMLDPRLVYSCAYWKTADDLADAQVAKLDLICRKLQLKSGMRVLDIGCGWGSWAKYAAEKYGVEVVGVTVSKEQAEYAKENVKGLSVEIRLQDYREVNEQFDAVMSLAMFEAVGYKNFRTFMEIVDRCLPDHGLFLLHTIGSNVSERATDPWIDKYIFPNGLLPSAQQITRAAEGFFVLEDWHSFGVYYYKTLISWHRNFIESWDELKDKYSERFKRMWIYYLLSSAGSFQARHNQLWQIVFSKGGVSGGYESVR